MGRQHQGADDRTRLKADQIHAKKETDGYRHRDEANRAEFVKQMALNPALIIPIQAIAPDQLEKTWLTFLPHQAELLSDRSGFLPPFLVFLT